MFIALIFIYFYDNMIYVYQFRIFPKAVIIVVGF